MYGESYLRHRRRGASDLKAGKVLTHSFAVSLVQAIEISEFLRRLCQDSFGMSVTTTTFDRDET